jgi:hypothetical protein
VILMKETEELLVYYFDNSYTQWLTLVSIRCVSRSAMIVRYCRVNEIARS